LSRIPYYDVATLPASFQEMLEEADRNGAPNRNLLQVLAHRPSLMEAFFRIWTATFQEGVLDHRLKEVVRVKIASMYQCGY
jgi:alkylhydroperoxidase family enzyme